MPNLIEGAFREEFPFVWLCSECDVIFDFGRVIYTPLTRRQAEQLNQQFEDHCKQTHPHSVPIVGVRVPKEDAT